MHSGAIAPALRFLGSHNEHRILSSGNRTARCARRNFLADIFQLRQDPRAAQAGTAIEGGRATAVGPRQGRRTRQPLDSPSPAGGQHCRAPTDTRPRAGRSTRGIPRASAGNRETRPARTTSPWSSSASSRRAMCRYAAHSRRGHAAAHRLVRGDGDRPPAASRGDHERNFLAAAQFDFDTVGKRASGRPLPRTGPQRSGLLQQASRFQVLHSSIFLPA